MDSFKPTMQTNQPNTADSPSMAGLLEALSGPDEPRHLTAERREVVLAQAVKPAAPWWNLLPLWDFRAVAGGAAAVVVALLALAVLPLARTPTPDAVVPVAHAVEDLRVSNSDGHVVLRWNSATPGPHRVIRATDPRRLASAPVHEVEGNTWVDPEPNGARLVYYRVEEAL